MRVLALLRRRSLAVRTVMKLEPVESFEDAALRATTAFEFASTLREYVERIGLDATDGASRNSHLCDQHQGDGEESVRRATHRRNLPRLLRGHSGTAPRSVYSRRRLND